MYLRFGENSKGDTLIEFQNIEQYFEKQLQLFSNLCYDRNYVNKSFFKNKLTASVLLKYIWNNNLSQGTIINILIFCEGEIGRRRVGGRMSWRGRMR